MRGVHRATPKSRIRDELNSLKISKFEAGRDRRHDMVHTPFTTGGMEWPCIVSLVDVYPVLLEYSSAGELTFSQSSLFSG